LELVELVVGHKLVLVQEVELGLTVHRQVSVQVQMEVVPVLGLAVVIQGTVLLISVTLLNLVVVLEALVRLLLEIPLEAEAVGVAVLLVH
jgi:hypothetical protein